MYDLYGKLTISETNRKGIPTRAPTVTVKPNNVHV